MTTSLIKGSANRGRALGNWSSSLSFVIMLILIVYPLATLLLQVCFPFIFGVHPNWQFSLMDARRVLSDKVNTEAIVNSFWIGAVAAVISVAIGTLTAFGSALATGRMRSVIHGGVWIIFFAPSFIVASGWVVLLQAGGILQQLFQLSPNAFNWFFTPLGLFLVMGLRYFPFAHFAIHQAIQNLGPEYFRAASLLGAKRRTVFVRVFVPLLMPALLAGATIAFAEGFGDFGLASVISSNMQIPLISYQIYSALYELPVDFSSAATLSLLVIIVTSGALLLQFWWLNRRRFGTATGASWADIARQHGRGRRLSISALIIVLLGLVLPFGAELVQSFWKSQFAGFARNNWTLANYTNGFAGGSQALISLGRTAEYAVVTAVCVMLLGLYVGHQMTFHKSRLSRIMNTLTMATIAIPGVVLGVGYVFGWNARFLVPLHLAVYGTPACLSLAYAAVHLPYAIRLQLSAMTQISPNLLTAAQVLGARKYLIMRSVVIPLVLETVVSTFLITLTGVMFELPAASLLYPSGQPPFSVLIDHLFADFQWAAGSALTIAGMILVVGAYLLGNWILRRALGQREGKGSESYVHLSEPSVEAL